VASRKALVKNIEEEEEDEEREEEEEDQITFI